MRITNWMLHVYLLGRSGNRLEALDLMVNKMHNIDMAIGFCAENGDTELWQCLIQFATNRPEQSLAYRERQRALT
uniref:Nuclear pore complex protein Nup85 n=1 Tax=Globodera pallida TaxID=36090 RepID=A0A183CC30_GLOPA